MIRVWAETKQWPGLGKVLCGPLLSCRQQLSAADIEGLTVLHGQAACSSTVDVLPPHCALQSVCTFAARCWRMLIILFILSHSKVLYLDPHSKPAPVAKFQHTWPLCAVECDTLSGWGSRLSPCASTYQRIISNNSYAHDEQGDNLDR